MSAVVIALAEKSQLNSACGAVHIGSALCEFLISPIVALASAPSNLHGHGLVLRFLGKVRRHETYPVRKRLSIEKMSQVFMN
jgi:hypothetical protein